MRHEKIVERKNGTKYQIFVNCHIDSYMGGAMNYRIDVFCKDKGSRKWLSLPDTLHDFQYRSLSLEDRAKHKELNSLRFVTKDEIYDAKIEAWNLLKPQM